MKVLITGATGLIGKELVKQCLAEDIDVHYLSTRKEKLTSETNYKGFYWNPSQGEIDTAAFLGVDTIINLAGASVSKRWTSVYKKEIRDSRITTISLIYNTLKNIEHKVSHFISASGISIYPSSLTDLYSEDHSVTDDSFLAQVTHDWETEADTLQELGIKVAKIRTGIVLDADGGALPKMMQPIKMGAGAPLGSGKQWQSWIHNEDMCRLYLFVLKHGLEGAYNGVAPHPVTNKELTKTIASTLKKPLWLPKVPGFVLKTILGEMGGLALESQNVSSQKIEASGFVFNYPTLPEALKNLL